jgi:hypothetical protein
MDQQLLIGALILVVILVAVVVVGQYRSRKRIKEMHAVAAGLGFEVSEGQADLVDTLEGFTHFRGGSSRHLTNPLCAKVDGVAVAIFDHSYTTGVGKRQSTHRQSVLLLGSERLDLPAFALRPETLGAKLSFLGQQDIDFEDQPGFSRTYVLQGPDELQIRALFSGEKLAFFAKRPGLCVDGLGQRLLYYRANKLISPKDIPSFVEEGLAVLHLLAGDKVPPAAEEG